MTVLLSRERSPYKLSVSYIRTPDVTPDCAALQKLAASPQQTQGGSLSSPHPSQPSQEESSPCSDMSSYEEPQSPLSAASSGPLAPPPAPAQAPVRRQPSRASDQESCAGRDAAPLCQRFVPNDPTKWNVEQVYEFIRSLPGQLGFLRRHIQEMYIQIFVCDSCLVVIDCRLCSSHRLPGDSR